MKVDISVGELLDKFSILQIKLNRMTATDKLLNVKTESDVLAPLCHQFLKTAEIDKYYKLLVKVNESLWEIEDAIREKERKKEFDEDFIKLARDVYFTNDRRAEIKKTINVLTRSELIEEKSYNSY